MFNEFTHCLSLFICSVICSINKLNSHRKTNQQSNYWYLCTKYLPTVANTTLCLFVCAGKQIETNCLKTSIFILLGTIFWPSSRFVSISWELENLNFASLRLT
jgi:hypothetical protein